MDENRHEDTTPSDPSPPADRLVTPPETSPAPDNPRQPDPQPDPQPGRQPDPQPDPTLGFPPAGHAQPGYAQPGYVPPGYPPVGYVQPGYPPPGYPPPGYVPPGYPPPGYPPPGYVPPGHEQQAYPPPGYPPPGYPTFGPAAVSYARTSGQTGGGPRSGRVGAVVAAVSLLITMLAFFAMPLIGGGFISLTGAQVAGAPVQLGRGFELLGLLWLVPVAAAGGLAFAVWQIASASRFTGRDGRGVATAVLAGVALLIYVVGLVILLSQGSRLSSGATSAILSALGAGFWLGLISAVVAMVGGFMAAAAARASIPGYPQ